MPFKLPSVEVALADLAAAGELLAATIKQQLVDQFEADDTREAGINSLIGSPDAVTGKAHSYTSAERVVKMQEPWREARRAVVASEAFVEDCRMKFIRAELVARLVVAAAERKAAA